MPDPDAFHVRVYQTTSVHKSMSALRQASIMLVADQLFGDVEEEFAEAFFTHTSTSPNQQIIATLDGPGGRWNLRVSNWSPGPVTSRSSCGT